MTTTEWLKTGRPMNRILHGDCMELMKHIGDNEFELAIVDPPYGIGKNWNKDTSSKFYNHKTTYYNQLMNKKYFDELLRISQNQIIWGANYYWNYLKPTSNIIWWDKCIDPAKHLRSAGELAWTSITRWPANKFKFSWNGCAVSEPRSGIHPHEKPIALYRWLLQNYAKPGDKIIDTHSGSGSLAIACHLEGFDFLAIEKDYDYWKASVERYETEINQGKLF